MRYGLMPVLKHELQRVASRWNKHYIQNNARARCPPGKPDMLYALGKKISVLSLFYTHLCKCVYLKAAMYLLHSSFFYITFYNT